MKTFITYLEDYKPSLRINIQQMELFFKLETITSFLTMELYGDYNGSL